MCPVPSAPDLPSALSDMQIGHSVLNIPRSPSELARGPRSKIQGPWCVTYKSVQLCDIIDIIAIWHSYPAMVFVILDLSSLMCQVPVTGVYTLIYHQMKLHVDD
jgi:hypothetical protein